MRFFSRRKTLPKNRRAPNRRRVVEPLETRSLLAANVLITEIMYHPASEDPRDEFIEIYNAEPTTVDLSGWRFSDGIDYTFPLGITLGAGQYLVIAADNARFETNYPTVSNFLAGWSGQLSNGGETIELVDASGDRVSRFTYADEGDWAIREEALGTPGGYDGWRWNAAHDGGGKSLELVNRNLTNDSGQNWSASGPNGGTPGRVNSVDIANSAPIIRNVVHSPIIPRSTDNVTITARITDELPTGLSVAVFWREATTVGIPGPSFTQANMFDDGLHGDGAAGDGVWGALLLAKPDKTIIEFYVRAVDAAGNGRNWPTAIHTTSGSTQGANALYQVDNAAIVDPNVPEYRLIFTPWELNEFNTNVARTSNAEMNVTLVSVINGVTEVRYNASVRYRGQGSRQNNPPNQRVNFPDDNTWRGIQAMNLNARFPYLQHVGMAAFELAGLPAEHPEQVMVRRNGSILPGSGSSQYGFYVHLEPINEDWAENHFPGDADGNAYRGQDWDLQYIDNNPASYRNRIQKQTNVSEDDFSDVIALGRAFSTSQTPDNLFVQRIEAAINVQQWLRWLAVNALLVNEENGLINNTSRDEYTLYRGVNDTRFVIAIHDLDNILSQGDQGSSSPTRNLFEPAGLPAFGRLMNHPNYRPYYFAHLKQLAETIFAPAQFNAWLDAELGNWVPASVRDSLKSFNQQRVSYVLSQIPPGTPDLSSPQDTLRVTELMYHASQGSDYDFIELKNTGPTAVNLQGVTIAGGINFTFPSINLNPNQNIVVAANEIAFRARYGAVPNVAGQYSGNLSNSGEQILLLAGSPLFNTILDFTYSDQWHPSTDGEGRSLVIVNPAAATNTWNTGSSWRASHHDGGSPGADDNEPLAADAVVISEVLSHTDQALGDRLELHNRTALTVNISNYYLSDDPANRTKYRIPNGTTISPGGYVAFNQANHFGPPNTTGVPFGLSELGDEVYFTAANGITTLDSIDFSAAEREVSFGRHTTSTGEIDYPPMATNTFGAANALPKIGPVVINELMYHPSGNAPGETEFVELKNVSASTVQLFDPSFPANTWAFTEGISFAFPTGVTVPAGGFLLVVPFDPAANPTLAAAFRNFYSVPQGTPIYGPFAGALDNAGEKVELSKPGSPQPDLTVPMIVVDRATYDDVAPWAVEPDGSGPSLSRKIPAAYANDPASWDASRPYGSPGAENTFIDRSPPTTPGGLVANMPQPGQLALQWNPASDPDSGVSAYRVYRDNVHIATATETSFVDTAIAPRARFDYQVSAMNAGGLEGGRSASVSAGYGAIDAVWPLDNSDTQLVVLFTEQVNPTQASNAGNYTLSGVSIASATPRPDGRSVVLATSPLAIGVPYTLAINNIGITFGSAFPPGTSYSYTHEPLSPGVATRTINSTSTLSTMNAADVALALPAGHPALAALSTQPYGRVNLVDGLGGNAGHFGGDSAFPSAILTSSPVAIRATGVVNVPTAGSWTFGLTAHAAQSGARLRIDGFDVIPHDPLNFGADRFGTAMLPAGQHFVDVVYFSNAGTAGIELFAAPGTFASFAQTTAWSLVGDTSAGGLPLSTQPAAAIDLPWLPGTIPGGFLTESTTTTASAEAGASLRYRATLSAGQTFSLLATPTSPSAQVALTLRRGSQVVATAAAPGPGVAAWLDNVAIAASGLYTIEIAPTATTTLTLRGSLAAGFEGEAFGQGQNDDRASAQSLDAAVVAHGDASRLAVRGSIVLPGVYHDLVAADNPVGYWRLDDPAGGSNVAVNLGAAGTSVNGVYFGGVLLGQPPIVPNLTGASAFFDGSNDRVEMADNPQINSAGPYLNRTVELWFNAGDVSARRVIFDEGVNTRGLNAYVFGGRLYVGAFNTTSDGGGTPWGPIFFSAPVATNRTYHVALTLDAAAQTFAAYLDGVAFGQSTAAGPLFGHTTGIRIGRPTDTLYHDAAAASTAHAFLGSIAEVSLYNATLSAERIAAHYLAGAAKADDYYAVTLAAGVPTSVVVDGAIAGNWTIELQNAGGDVLATSTPGPANADASIRNFVAPANGVYYVRIGANVASTYSAFVTRGAEFEREANDSVATAQDISPAGSVWGGLHSPADVDAFSISVSAGQTLTIETATPDTLVGANAAVWNPRIELHAPGGGVIASDDNGAPDGRNARLIHAATQTGNYVVVVRSASGSGDYLLTVDSSGGGETPQLVDVLVVGGQWAAEFLDLLDARGLGDGGWSVLAPGATAANLPWTNIDRVQLVFDRPVTTAIGDLSLSGVATGQNAVASFQSAGNVATWILTNAMSADRFTADLSASLESTLGGQPRQYQFNVLPGDVNDDDVVAAADVFANRPLQFRTTTDNAFDPRHDVDGNGVINFVDTVRIRNQIGASLPSGSPAAPAAIVAAALNRREVAAETPVPVVRASARRTLSPSAVDAAVDRLEAPRTITETSQSRPLDVTRARRPARGLDPAATARLLSRDNLDAGR